MGDEVSSGILLDRDGQGNETHDRLVRSDLDVVVPGDQVRHRHLVRVRENGEGLADADREGPSVVSTPSRDLSTGVL